MDIAYEFLQRVFIAIGVGAMIGLEREYSVKQRTVGMRSFALVSFLGCISALLANPSLMEAPFGLAYLPYIGLVMVIGYSFSIYYFLAIKKEILGVTTVLVLPLAYLFGMLIGMGFLVEAVIAAILVTILLYSRRYSHMFVSHLTEAELADALLFATVLFIVYPLLPAEPIYVLGLELALPRIAEAIVLFSLVSFAGFIAVRLLGPKALPLTGFFAGFVSALYVVASYANFSKKRGADQASLSSGIFSANIASLLGDVIVLAYLNASLLLRLALPLGGMLLLLGAASLFFWRKSRHLPLKLTQPFSVVQAAKFAVAFFFVTLAIQALSRFGSGAVYLLSFLSGAVSVTPVVVSLALEAIGPGAVLTQSTAAQAVMAAIIGGMLAKSGVLFFSASPQQKRAAIPVLLASAAIGGFAFILSGA